MLLQTIQQQQQQSEADDNIKVVVRVRPLFPAELAKGATNVIQVAEDCGSLQVGDRAAAQAAGVHVWSTSSQQQAVMDMAFGLQIFLFAPQVAHAW